MKVAVIGGGGREHAIVCALKKSPKVDKLYCIPGNAGISADAECVAIKATDLDGIIAWVKQNPVDLVMVAPDDPLSLGLVDRLTEIGVRAFGPTAAAAKIESSKAFSKDLMKKYGIPTAGYEVFDDADQAKSYLATANMPIVVKADGLALGKGVIICNTREEALRAVDGMMLEGAFGKAGSRVVIEEFLTGFEVSVLCFTDGKTIVPMVSSQDHKRALDHDEGLNTGGMGAFSPSPKYTELLAAKAYQQIFVPTMQAMNAEGRPFKGVLYFGLMIKGEDIRVLEYNARFGDPETQVVLPRLKTDLLDIMQSVIDERLQDQPIVWDERPAVCVVMASGGYPVSYQKGYKIKFGELDSDVVVYHAGTAFDADGDYVNVGGRVLGVTAMGDTMQQAIDKAYANVKRIEWKDVHYRTDIGRKALQD